MKQLNLQNVQNNLRKKFLKAGVKMIGPETIFFSKDTKIGKNVIIGAGTLVNKNIPDETKVLGIPAKIIDDEKK